MWEEKVAVIIVAYCSDNGNKRDSLTFDLLYVVVRRIRTTTYSYIYVEGPRRRAGIASVIKLSTVVACGRK